jgi:GT2 family glycosyltransferase
VAAAVHSVTEATVPVLVLVIDNNSDSPTRRILFDLAAEDTRVDVRLAHRNLGTAAGRRLASELVETEFVLFLDDDAELMPGALESLLTDLDAHPEAAGVTGLVVEPDGIVHHCGGSMAVSEERVTFTLEGAGLEFDDFRLPPTGPAGWAPGTASLFRAEALREFLIDEEMTAYYEDNEWCYRVELARPGSFRRCREALVLHHLSRGGEHESQLITCSEKVEKLLAQAHFLHAHGRLLDVDLLWLVPELRRPDWSLDTDAARLLLELIAARGTDWATMAWCSGELEPLLGRARVAQELEQAKEQAQAHEAALATLEQRNQTLEQRNDTLLSIEAGGWWRLRSRLLPLLRLASVVRDFSGARS